MGGEGLLIGNRTFSVRDLARIALDTQCHWHLVLDRTAVHEIATAQTKAVPCTEAFVLPNDFGLHMQSPGFLPRPLVRAILCQRLNILLQARSGVRVDIVLFITELLNNGITPSIPIPSTVQELDLLLMPALMGRGGCHYSVIDHPANGGATRSVEQYGPLADVLQQHKISCPVITVVEADSIRDSLAASVAIGALSLFCAEAIGDYADLISALSIEFCGLSLTPFDAFLHETCRPHKGAINVAERLRLLLDGSKFVVAGPSTDRYPRPYLSIPQVHGTLHDVVLRSLPAIQVEVNSAECGPHADALKRGGIFFSEPLLIHLAGVTEAILETADLSFARATENARRLAAELAVAGIADSPTTIDQPLQKILDGVRDQLSGLRLSVSGMKQRSATLASSSAGAGSRGDDGEKELRSFELVRILFRLVEATELALQSELNVALHGFAERERQQLLRILDKERRSEQQRPPTNNNAAAAAANPPVNAKAAAAAAARGGSRTPADLRKKSKLVLGKYTRVFRDFVMQRVSAGSLDVVIEGLSTLQLDRESVPKTLAEMEQVIAVLPGTPDAVREALRSSVSVFDLAVSEYVSQELLTFSQVKRKPKIPKGTRDFAPEQMAIRERAFGIITSVFKRHGAVAIDTPVFELKETLTGKYGEDSKLIYDLADQGGELLSLRYDLTVPLARYIAMKNIGNIKRYHIARVYRRDQPAMNRGRYREFYQCDFDIAGQAGTMIHDAEVLKVMIEILDGLNIGDYVIKYNHRRLLDTMLDVCGVPPSKFRTICSAIDKLDKEPWEVVRAEMVEEKGLDAEVADRIGKFVILHDSPRALHAHLLSSRIFGDDVRASETLKEVALLFDYLESFGALHRVSFDLSLARGLDYYTGSIYEAVIVKGDIPVGSIAAGGRYDNLVGMFTAGKQVPCVGCSIGIERVMAIMEAKELQERTIRPVETQVFVASIGDNLLRRRMEICAELWRSDLKAEFDPSESPKLKKQLTTVLESQIPFMVIFGESEMDNGVVKVKEMKTHVEEEVKATELVAYLKARL